MPKNNIDTSSELNISMLNDFIYSVLYNAATDDKIGLSGKYLSACENLNSAKKFLTTATREEKEHLLAHFGYEFFYVIVPERLSHKKFKELVDSFIGRGGTISDLKKEGFYVHTDKELIHLLGLAARAIHNNSFHLNLELCRQGYHIKKWSRQNPIKDDAEIKEVAENDNVLMRTLLSASITMNYQPGLGGLTDTQTQILLYLYINRSKSISHSELNNLFAGYKGKYKAAGFKSSISGLLSNQLIQKSPVDKKLTITSLGIKKCQEYREAVLINNSNF